METLMEHKRELTPQEHWRAQEIAYFIAMKRGDGKVPPYEPVLAVRDFCQAAGELSEKRGADLHERRAQPC